MEKRKDDIEKARVGDMVDSGFLTRHVCGGWWTRAESTRGRDLKTDAGFAWVGFGFSTFIPAVEQFVLRSPLPVILYSQPINNFLRPWYFVNIFSKHSKHFREHLKHVEFYGGVNSKI